MSVTGKIVQVIGSTFDADGQVTQGPARRNLPAYEIFTDEKGNLLVKISDA